MKTRTRGRTPCRSPVPSPLPADATVAVITLAGVIAQPLPRNPVGAIAEPVRPKP